MMRHEVRRQVAQGIESDGHLIISQAETAPTVTIQHQQQVPVQHPQQYPPQQHYANLPQAPPPQVVYQLQQPGHIINEQQARYNLPQRVPLFVPNQELKPRD